MKLYVGQVWEGVIFLFTTLPAYLVRYSALCLTLTNNPIEEMPVLSAGLQDRFLVSMSRGYSGAVGGFINRQTLSDLSKRYLLFLLR